MRILVTSQFLDTSLDFELYPFNANGTMILISHSKMLLARV